MMSEWLSYRLSDFVMVSSRVYDRQLELHNESFVGLQLISLALGALIVWIVVCRPGTNNWMIPTLLGLVWLWVGWSFLWHRYGDVNLVAHHAALAFAVQGAAFLATFLYPGGLAVRLPEGSMRAPAIALLTFALILYPLLAPLFGRPARTAEFFALMPDPTAIATLAILAVSQNAIRWPLTFVPVMWCAVSAATLWVFNSPQFWVVALAPPLFVALAFLAPR